MPARISPQPKPVEQPAPARRPATPPPASFAEVINLWSSANDLAVVLDPAMRDFAVVDLDGIDFIAVVEIDDADEQEADEPEGSEE